MCIICHKNMCAHEQTIIRKMPQGSNKSQTTQVHQLVLHHHLGVASLKDMRIIHALLEHLRVPYLTPSMWQVKRVEPSNACQALSALSSYAQSRSLVNFHHSTVTVFANECLCVCVCAEQTIALISGATEGGGGTNVWKMN